MMVIPYLWINWHRRIQVPDEFNLDPDSDIARGSTQTNPNYGQGMTLAELLEDEEL